MNLSPIEPGCLAIIVRSVDPSFVGRCTRVLGLAKDWPLTLLTERIWEIDIAVPWKGDVTGCITFYKMTGEAGLMRIDGAGESVEKKEVRHKG